MRDWAEVKHDGKIDVKVAREAISKLDIDELGLDKNDHNYLSAIIEKFAGGPVGLLTLAATLSEDQDTIEDVIEPYLLQLGFINRTPKGRVATPAVYNHLKIENLTGQNKLL